MADFTDDRTTVSSFHDSGDISLVLSQILRPSSPLPPPPQVEAPVILPSATVDEYSQISAGPAVFSCSDRISVDRVADDTLNGVVLSSSSRFFPGSGQMTGFVQEYTEECDCGNEDTTEPVVEEVDMKRNQPRNQSKRGRAAEVHNISEKRRRSKINEKMKALQNLIPNSNKTDKASMLDEAIEYLKQLQLQVQMLSIKNGLNLHAMCLPGASEIFHSAQLSQIGGDVGHRCGSLDVPTTNVPNAITPSNTLDSDGMLSLPKQYSSQGAALPVVSTIINSEATSFGEELCVIPNFSSFELHDQAICRNQRTRHNLHYVSNTEMKAQDISESDSNKYKLLEEEVTQKCGTQMREMLPENISVANQLTSDISGLFAATTSAPNDTRRAKGSTSTLV